MSAHDEYLEYFNDFYSEFGKVRDLLANADNIVKDIERYWQGTESKRKGLEFLSSILVDAIAKCESAAETLEESKQ